MKKILFGVLFISLIFPLVGCDVNINIPTNPGATGTPTPGASQGALYTRLLGGAGLDTKGYDIAANDSGIYITGETSGSLDGLTATGNKVAFLAKYDTSGNKQKTILYYGQPNRDTIAHAITAGTSGVYLTGGWFDGGASTRAFIAKFDNSGNKLWEQKPIATNISTPGDSSYIGWGIASDSTGVYVTGETCEYIGQGDYPYNHNTFIAKYGANGNVIWTQLMGSNLANTCAKSIAVDPSGFYVYVTGYTIDVLDGVRKSNVDAFVAKYNASTGQRLWVKQLGGTATAICHGVAITANSSGIYMICHCTYSDNFDGVACPSVGTQSFMVKFDPSGNNHQTKFLGAGRSNFFVEDITSDSTGVYMVGDSGWQAFVAKYDFFGNEVGIKALNSLPTNSYGNGITKTASGIYITGYADGDLDGQTHLGTNDAFITDKLNF